MGMFDSIYDATGSEWQTKALGRNLARFQIGDPVPSAAADCQIAVVGEVDGSVVKAYATIRAGRVEAVPAQRDHSLPHLVSGTYIVQDEQSGTT